MAVTTPAAPAAPAPLVVRVQIPRSSLPERSAPPTALVGIEGPDGRVRYFELEGGRDAIVTRGVTLRPGESVTINFTPTSSRR